VNLASTRALLRIGRRNVARSRWRSALVVVLILLPVAGMVGMATILATSTPSPERVATHQMGQADLLVYPGDGGDEATLRAKLPAGSRIEPIVITGGTLIVPGLAIHVTVASEDPNGLAKGMLALVEGRWPTAPDEVGISAAFAKLAGASIGSTVELRELGRSTVVGFVEDELQLGARLAVVPPPLAGTGGTDKTGTWLVALPAGTDPATLDPALVPPSGPTALQFMVTTRAQTLAEATSLGPTTIVLGGLALVDAALVAAAAFAVGVRRRQRELGLLSAAGATPRQLAGSVLAEALLLGGLGAAAGVVVGILGGLAISPFLDELTGHRNPGLILDTSTMVAALVLGLLAALVAAFAPAWSAARMSVLMALSGRRPPASSPRRSLGIGVALIATGVVATAIGAGLRIATTQGELNVWLLLAGAVLGTLGFGACSGWFLSRLEGPAARLPLASRIALRDTARARNRNGPIVTALLAATAATIALAAYQTSFEAANLAHFRPPFLPDQVSIQGPGVAQAGPEAARALGATAGAIIPGAGSDTRYVWVSSGDPNQPSPLVANNLTVGDPELLRALGAGAAVADLEAGKAIALAQQPASLTSVTVHIDNATDGSSIASPDVPATVVVLGVIGEDLPGAVISAATASRLGIPAGHSERYILRLGHAVTDADIATVAGIAGKYPDTYAFTARPPDVAGAGFRFVIIGGSLLFALTVTGIAVALGEAESRPEQQTLLAVGADPRLRRRITAARAGIIALLGGVLAVPAGLLPVWGVLITRHSPLVVPGLEVVAIVALLPILAITATWVLSRPIPDWSAFRGRPS
jgi:putative ABC transport system permease protein